VSTHSTAWPDPAFASASPRATLAWRGVEAQHIVATMRLVDSLAEQTVLEQLLEASKPALPASARPERHFLLTTPFRYRSPFASRFRRAGAAGVWYGGETLQTAAAEVAYWRWRFLAASDGLRDQELLTAHTFFQARVSGLAIDLTEPPWLDFRADWVQDSDYRTTQAIARAAVEAGVQWLRYESVRQAGGFCAAVFDAAALALADAPHQQTWHCKVRLMGALMVHDADRFEWGYSIAGNVGKEAKK
jgi:hypothetical protein